MLFAKQSAKQMVANLAQRAKGQHGPCGGLHLALLRNGQVGQFKAT
jgi:hypothetical protein